jgi:hypothetical protein
MQTDGLVFALIINSNIKKMNRFENKIALVTGSSQGIGAAARSMNAAKR